MKSVKQLMAEREELLAKVDAIVALAKQENRELAADEATEVDSIHAKLADGGEIAAQLERAQRIEALAKQRAPKVLAELEDSVSDTPRIVVPAVAKRHGPLKAFIGPNAEEDAYVSGQVILAQIFGNPKAADWCREHGITNSMTTNDNAQGGYLVPEPMQAAIVRLREERGVFPRYANPVPMGSDIIKVPRLLSDVTAYWTGEEATITASDPTLGDAELMARKLAAMTRISSELNQDAVVSIADLVTTSMAYAMADKIDDAAFNGDGTSTYGGVVGLKNALNSAAIQDAISGNVGATTLDLEDLEYTVAKYPQYPGASPRWFMHSAVYWAGPARLMLATGGNTVANLAGGPSLQLLGYPVEFVQVMPSTTGSAASTILAYFGDLRLGCAYGTRQTTNVAISTERYFEQDQIALRATERIGILVHERGDTIRNRPIVALKTAAS